MSLAFNWRDHLDFRILFNCRSRKEFAFASAISFVTAMESNESSDSAILVDWRKSAAGTNGRRRSTSTSVWTSGIVLAVVLVCTTLLAFSSPAKILTNPMGRSHTWLPSFHTPNNNDNDPDPRHEQPSLTVFSFIFPSSDNNTNASNSEKRNTSDNLIGDQNRAKESNATATTGPINSGDQGPKALSSAKNISDALKSTRGVGFVWKRQCDIFDGRWMPVRDESYPYYPAGTCPYIDQSFDCFRNGRPDKHYEKWRWQPNECSMPRLNASDMLERLRGKRLVLVGDSLNRNMWESLVCILRHSLKHKNRVYEVSGRHEFKTEGFYSFGFQDYNCSVDFVRSPFLVQEWQMHDGNGTTKETLRLDIIESSSSKYIDADIIVFNTGHWWTHEKTSKGRDYYQEGDHVYSELNVIEAYRKALETWARWVDANINPNKTQVFFRGYSASHFSGGQWNSGGKCHTETQPIFNMSYLIRYPPKMNVLESIVHKMKTPVVYLNITRMTDYRKDGHPSVYGNQYTRHEDRMAPDRYQDCSHWCLPGVPDAWNELLYASLLMKGLREWAT